MAGKVRTVLGDVEAEKLGFTMPHEHILTAPKGGGGKNNVDHTLDSIELGIVALNEFKEAGGGCIVETTPQSWGRNPQGMVAVSRGSGVHIIACTGYICEEHGMEPEVSSMTIDDLAQKMIDDVTKGMDGTDIKAGWCKAGTAYNHITKNEEKQLRAAARAAAATGVCMHTHTTDGTMGIEQIEIVEDEGCLPLERMIVAHVDRVPDLWYHRQMLKKGVYLIYDGPGKAKYYPDSMRVELLRQLVADGYEDRLMLSNDMGRRSHHTAYGFGPGLAWIKKRFIPRLLDEGFSEQVVHKFQYENPQRIYAMAGGKA